jgi:hypothetical protein|tara:strand:+ start:40 stop:774 length:735 start_codon:yes stop_codon:yes gene_type:complete
MSKRTDKSLTIYPVKSKPDDRRFKDLHPHLLKPPFLLIMNATTGSFKTTACANLILRENFYNQIEEKYFDFFVIISPTIYNCATSVPLVKYADAIYDQYDDSIIDGLIEIQKEDDEEQHILLLIDDMLGEPMNRVKYLASRNRHFRISIIISLQSFKSKGTHPILRQNASGYLIGAVKSTKEYIKMEEEFAELFGGKHNFRKIYLDATREPYSFLNLDLKGIRAYKNYTDLLWQKGDTEEEMII